MTKQEVITVSLQCKQTLKGMKTHSRETPGDVVNRLIEFNKKYNEENKIVDVTPTDNPTFDEAVKKVSEIHKDNILPEPDIDSPPEDLV